MGGWIEKVCSVALIESEPVKLEPKSGPGLRKVATPTVFTHPISTMFRHFPKPHLRFSR